MKGLGYLSGLAGALPLSLSIDSLRQVVGGKATYRLSGAPPGTTVLWSSFKNGKETGELRSGYGQVVEPNGTLELTSEAWRTDDVGNWIKTVEVIDAEGKSSTAFVEFMVAEAPVAAAAQGYVPPQSNVLFYLGDFAVTPGIAIAGGLALLLLTGKGKLFG
jgi:hypothetical protein